MYSENNRRAASRRSDNDFLRRMTGGELCGDCVPVVNMNTSGSTPRRDENKRPCNEGDVTNLTPGGKSPYECPTHISAPSLAMVYTPRQCWQNLLDPESGLRAGSIFAELVMPFGRCPNYNEKEGRSRCIF